jgi:hypothetical protein
MIANILILFILPILSALEYSRELETVYPIQPSFTSHKNISDKFISVNQILESTYPWYKFRKTILTTESIRSNERYDTLSNDFSRSSLVFRIRRSISGPDQGTEDLTLKYSSPFKALCEDYTELKVTEEFQKDSKEKIEQDISYSWETLDCLSPLEPYAISFGRSLKVKLSDFQNFNTIEELEKVYRNVNSLIGNNNKTANETDLVLRAVKYEWFQKFSITIGGVDTTAVLLVSYNSLDEAKEGSHPVKTEMEFKFVDDEYKAKDLEMALRILRDVYGLMQIS